MKTEIDLILITGPIGVGKSAVLAEIGDHLTAADFSHAQVDCDELSQFHPREPGDRFGGRIGMRNLVCLGKNFRAAGIARFVVARTCETAADADDVARALVADTRLVFRLTAPVDVLRKRVGGRELGSGREWHLERAAELATILDTAAIEDHLVLTAERTIAEIAAEILELAGWIDKNRSGGSV